jgi:hypothetical protein
MMTDQQIRSHLVSGGAKTNNNSDGVSFIGDMIVGAKGEKKKRKRRVGPRFAWEEEDEDEQEEEAFRQDTHKMIAAPTLDDIMDEEDEVDLMSPLKVNKAFGSTEATKSLPASKKRPRNEALAELAIFSKTGESSAPTDGNASIGWNLLRVLGYRSRLGVALVPLQGFDNSDKCLLDSLDKSSTHEAKWLASKRLRAIHLPSIQNCGTDEDGHENKTKIVDVGVDTTRKTNVLIIPPTKINKHGIGYDPFKNAPEFRAFHEQRKRMALNQGKEYGDGSADRRRQHQYLTDDVSRGARRPWEDAKGTADKDDFDDDSEDNPRRDDKNQTSHYAADRNFEHLIGTKASSGFALEDEDDTNVYDCGDSHSFPQRDKHDSEMSNYALEVQSPAASDEEDNVESSLFGNYSQGKRSKSSTKESAGDGGSSNNIADAWSAWGLGIGESAASKALTQDGKPPLEGFVLGRKKFLDSQSSKQDNSNGADRYEGPKVPAGYVLKRHVFAKEDTTMTGSNDALDINDCGLGLDLQARQSQPEQNKSKVPKVLPESEPPKAATKKLLAKDGTALNFHAVRESMKNRFVSGSTSTTQDGSHEVQVTSSTKANEKDKDEWVDVTISTWMPARLLCKRMGVAVPTNYEGADTNAVVKRSGEEEYFQNTIYDPAVAKRREKGKEKSEVFDVQDDALVESNYKGAVPTRPNESIFQSIFDNESELDLSDLEIVNADTLQHASEVNDFDVHGRARKKRQQIALEEESSEPKPDGNAAVLPPPEPEIVDVAKSNQLMPQPVKGPSPPRNSDDSSSNSEHKRRNKRKHHKRHYSESDSDDSRRRRKQKHKSRSKEKKRKKEKIR